MLTIKLNENINSGMLYAIAYCEDPDIYSEDFWGWDTESDVGYELMEFSSLIQDADIFDSLEAAEDRADDVLSSIFENEVFIVGLDPYTPHNLTGFVKKVTRDSINESKSMDEVIKVGDKVKVSTPGNDYYNGRTGVVDYTEDGIVTVKFDDNSSPRLNNFDLNQVTRINESKSIKEDGLDDFGVSKSNADTLSTRLPDSKFYINDNKYVFGRDLVDYFDEDEIISYSQYINADNIRVPNSYRINGRIHTTAESIKEDMNDSDEVLTFKRDINLASDADEIQLLIYELSDGVAEDIAQQAFNENESNDLETLKSAVITAIDVYFEDNEWLDESKSIKESTTRDYVEVAYICDGFTNFRVYGGGFKTSDALVAVEDEKGKRLRLTMGDVCEFYTWYDAKGNVIHEPTYYSED